jgi:hypothetical protein
MSEEGPCPLEIAYGVAAHRVNPLFPVPSEAKKIRPDAKGARAERLHCLVRLS